MGTGGGLKTNLRKPTLKTIQQPHSDVCVLCCCPQVETSISQAFGSNIFDILIAFGLPYTILCAMQGWEPVPVDAGNITMDGLIDVGVLLVFIGLLVFYRMRLTR